MDREVDERGNSGIKEEMNENEVSIGGCKGGNNIDHRFGLGRYPPETKLCEYGVYVTPRSEHIADTGGQVLWCSGIAICW